MKWYSTIAVRTVSWRAFAAGRLMSGLYCVGACGSPASMLAWASVRSCALV